MKKYLIFVLAAVLAASLFGCGITDETIDVGDIYSAWAEMDFEGLSSHIAIKNDSGDMIASRNVVAQRISGIYDALKVKSLSINDSADIEATTIEGFLLAKSQQITITCVTDTVGTFSFEAKVNFVNIDDEWQLLFDYGLIIPTMNETDAIYVNTISAKRGEIFTADNVCVAKNVYAPTLYIRPSSITAAESNLASQISVLTGVEASEILEKLHSDETARDGIAVIKVYSPKDDISELRSAIAGLDGVGIDESFITPVRLYPFDANTCKMSHIVGYVGSIPEASLEDYLALGYDEYDTVGLSGLESSYEEKLRGEKGASVTLTDKDGNTRTILKKDAVSGEDLILTIDSRMQLKAEQALASKLSAGQGGSAIILDPSTGAVLAMASYPMYDNNFFTLPVTDTAEHQAQWDQMMSDAGNYPLLFRSTQGKFVPGSTAKVLTAAAALDTGTMSASYVFSGNVVGRTWYPSIADWYYPGITRHTTYYSEQNMTNALIYSDNIYFANAAMMIGAEKYVSYMTKLGFFESLPFDLPVSYSQISSGDDRTYVENIKFLADMGYGQGEMQTTPIMMATLYSALCNNGSIMTPHLVAETRRTYGTENKVLSTTAPTVWKESVITPSTVNTLRGMMRQVVESGTATSLNIRGLGVSGKTGTAEAGNNKQHSWFIGFTTEGGDARVVCVTLDVKENQGYACQPIAKELFTAQGTDSIDSINAQTAGTAE